MPFLKDEESLSKITDFFYQRPEVSALYLFGSFMTGNMKPDSDIDIGVLLNNKNSAKKEQYIEEILRYTLRGISLVILNTAPVSLRYEILRKGRLVFDKDSFIRKKFIEVTAREYFDFEPYEKLYLKKRIQKIRNG